MKLQPDDPRLTAYALGELDASEATVVATAIEQSAECRRAVEEARQTAGLLAGALQTKPCAQLSTAQRGAIEAALASAPAAHAAGKTRHARPSFLAALFAWRPQYATIGVWTTACLMAIAGWALWLEVFRASSHDGGRQHSEFAIKLHPTPAASPTPSVPPPPPPSAPNQLAMQAVTPRPLLSQLPLTNAWLAACNGTWTYSTYSLGGGGGCITLPLAITGGTGPNAAATAQVDLKVHHNALVFNGGVLQVRDDTLKPLKDPSGAVTINGAGALYLTDANTCSGVTSLTAGRNGFSGSTFINGGTLVPSNPSDVSMNLGSSGVRLRLSKSVIGSLNTAPPPTTESYAHIRDNPFLSAAENPLSTFSIDVDTASYANVRRFLLQGSLPSRDAVRIEEMLNYFTYDYPQPKRGEPFSVNVEVAGCPWDGGHRLVRIGLKGREVPAAKRPPCNLVFLIDVSGSMGGANKLSLIKPALRMLVERLTGNERVAIVVYNERTRVALPSTSGDRKQEIINVIESLNAAGSTNGADGIRLAYDVATRHFIERGVNRVILCTDGDFNVGTVKLAELTRLIERERQAGVFLSVLGFGMGNLKDSTMERLADKGNGHYAYIDSLHEARKVFVGQMNGTLVTIAKDVKVQVEFNPAQVSAYRLIGYEDRVMRKEDFNNDRKDAGEIGAGHTVTALYEIVPPERALASPAVDPLRYQRPAGPAREPASRELLTVKLRYKQPDGDKSSLIERPVTDSGAACAAASRDFKFAAAVAAFGMVLRDCPHKGSATLDAVLELAEEGRGPDKSGCRTEFLSLVKKAQALAGK